MILVSKSLPNVVTLTVFLACLSSCESSFDVNSDTQFNKPVIYALLNPSEITHNVRIHRVFQPTEDPLQYSGVPDSLYFNDLTVKLYFCTSNGIKYYEHLFQKRTIESTNYGEFNTDTKVVYTSFEYLNKYFIPNNSVYLSVESSKIEQTSISSQVIKDRPLISYPHNDQKNYTYFYESNPLSVRWITKSQFKKFQLSFLMTYHLYKGDHVVGKNEAEVVFMVDGMNRSFSPVGDAFFAKLRRALPTETVDFDYRKVLPMSLVLSTADSTFFDFMSTNKIADDRSGAGFTNIVNGLGLFSLRYSDTIYPINMDQRSLDSLAFGRYTKDLRFSKW